MLNRIKEFFSLKVKLSHEEDLIAQNIFYLLPEQDSPYSRWQIEQACAMLADTKMFTTYDIEYVKYLILKNKI